MRMLGKISRSISNLDKHSQARETARRGAYELLVIINSLLNSHLYTENIIWVKSQGLKTPGRISLISKQMFCVCVLVTQSCLTLCNPMDCSPPGSSVHGILQERILEWVAIPFSRGSSWPRDQTWVSCIAGRFFTI